MTHIALLGDSVIDNGAYVGDGPDVAEQVRNLVPDEWKVTRLAIDGAVTSIIFSQLEDLPTDTTHIVLSVGGNDALGEADVLDAPAHSVAEALQRLAGIQDRFREDYASMLDATARLNLPTAVCTVYDPRYPDPLQRRMGSLGLSVINDVVTREAFFAQPFSDRPAGDVRCGRGLRQSDRAVRAGRHEAGSRHSSVRVQAAWRDARDPIRGGLIGRIFTAYMYYPLSN